MSYVTKHAADLDWHNIISFLYLLKARISQRTTEAETPSSSRHRWFDFFSYWSSHFSTKHIELDCHFTRDEVMRDWSSLLIYPRSPSLLMFLAKWLLLLISLHYCPNIISSFILELLAHIMSCLLLTVSLRFCHRFTHLSNFSNPRSSI